MAMTYTTLTAAKGVQGSIATWVNYAQLDVATILDEAQALLYSLLRTREMMTVYRFTMASGTASIALPSRFLDPIGRMWLTTFSMPCRHKDASFVQQARTYTESTGNMLGSPFTTTSGSNTVAVTVVDHGFNQDSMFHTSGAVPFNGVTINGTFPITSITDTDHFTIDITNLGSTPTGSGTGPGGGGTISYICDNITTGIPNWWSTWDERLQFDVAFSQNCLCALQFYQSLPLLSSSNQTNFLTDRYPHLLRTACVASAADFMKDDTEYQKGVTRLTGLVQTISAENDGYLRGAELDTMTP